MHSFVQFLTTPTADTPGTGLILHFDNKRYFFGQAHEGLQRASLQQGSKLLKVREIFLTGKIGWQTVGGLLGAVLTLADSVHASVAAQNEQQRLKRDRAVKRGQDETERWLNAYKPGRKGKPRPVEVVPEVVDLVPEPLGIHGAPNIMHMLATARSFVYRKGMPLDVYEHVERSDHAEAESEPQPTWQDSNIKVWAIPITPLETSNTIAVGHGIGNSEEALSKKRSLEKYMSGQQNKSMGWEESQAAVHNEADDEAQKTREKVVNAMFRSNWQFDNLVEIALSDVKMPTKIFVRDPETKSIQPYEGPVPDGTTPAPNIKVLVRQPWPGASFHRLPPTTPSSTALSYIIRNHEQRGKFLAQAARDLGVPAYMNSRLARGQNVYLDGGKVITPSQVLEPAKEGSGVAIVDLPSSEYVPALLRRPEWKQEKTMTGVEAFIWILGPTVTQDKLLLGFMEEFKHLKHIISSPNHCPNQFMMTSAACASVQHHVIDPARYPLLQHHNIDSANSKPIVGDHLSVVAKPGLMVRLEPSFLLQDHEVNEPVNLVQAIDEMPKAVYHLAKRAKEDIAAEITQSPLGDQELPSPNAEIICLGTGSALPSQYRNVAGTLLRVPGYGSYLFDAGEGTLGQLKRIFSPEELVEVLKDLKMIWISHLHADHHLGTTAVIKAWYEAVHGQDIVKRRRPSTKNLHLHMSGILKEGRRLFVVGSKYMMRWLHEFSSVEDYGYDQLVPLEVTPSKNPVHPGKTTLGWENVDLGFKTAEEIPWRKVMSRETGLQNLVACWVDHCYDATAVTVTFFNGFKFSYSGDCRPSSAFAAIGKGSTVLVHEATFDDEMRGDAIAKRHSTISEAVGVGVAMGARRVILTHFSQRYSKIPTMNDVRRSVVKLEQAVAEDRDETGPVEDLDVQIETEDPTLLAKDDNQGPVSMMKEPRTRTSEEVSLAISTNLPRAKDFKIAFAFDYMRVKVEDIGSLEKYVPALRELYKSDQVRAMDERQGKFPAQMNAPGGPRMADSKSNKGGSGQESSKSSRNYQKQAIGQDAEVNALHQESLAGTSPKEEVYVMSTARRSKQSKLVSGEEKAEVGWSGPVENRPAAPLTEEKQYFRLRQLATRPSQLAQPPLTSADRETRTQILASRKRVIHQTHLDFFRIFKSTFIQMDRIADGKYGAGLQRAVGIWMMERRMMGRDRVVREIAAEVYDCIGPRVDDINLEKEVEETERDNVMAVPVQA